MGSNVKASLMLPSTRTPGALNTGIWRPGRNRPERYTRPGQAPREGRDALKEFTAQLEVHGQELTFAPLEEVADIALDGILADKFWIYLPSDRARGTIEARAASMAATSDPEYLVAPSPWNVPKKEEVATCPSTTLSYRRTVTPGCGMRGTAPTSTRSSSTRSTRTSPNARRCASSSRSWAT